MAAAHIGNGSSDEVWNKQTGPASSVSSLIQSAEDKNNKDLQSFLTRDLEQFLLQYRPLRC